MAMIRNNLSPLAWYTDKSMQGFRRSYAYGRQFPNGAPMHRLLPFQIVVTTDTALSVSSVILEYDDGGRIDITADIKLAGLSTHDYISGYGYEVVVFPALTDWLNRETPVAGNDTTALHEGFACLHLTLTGGSSPVEYWSEVMALIPSMYGYLQVAWSSLTDVIFEGGRIVYEDAPSYVNRLWLRTEVGMPEYEQSDEGEDRNGFFFATKQTSEKTYHMNFVATEEMCDALRIVGLSDVVTIIDPDGRTYNCDTFLMTPKWQEQGYLASVDCEFQTDTVVVRPANSTSLTAVTPKFYNASGGGIAYLALDGQSGSTQISVSPYFDGTTVTSNVSWLVVSVNGGQLTLTRTKNDTGTSRTATITAKTPYGKTATLSVSQSKAVSLPSITQTSLSVAKTGGSYTINIVDPDNVGWKLTCGTGALNNGGTTLTGSGTTAVTVTYPANTTSAAIDDTITLSSTDEAYSEDYDALLVVREAGESKHKFTISSVTPASASVYINGVETKSAEIAEGGTIVVTAKASGYDDYSANYTMETSDMSVTVSMTAEVKKTEPSISPTSASVDAGGGTVTFTISDPDSQGWSIAEGSASLESFTVKSGVGTAGSTGVSGGSGDAIIEVVVHPNGSSARTHTLIFTGTGSNKTTVTITQTAKVIMAPRIETEDNSRSIDMEATGGSHTMTVSDPDGVGWSLASDTGKLTFNGSGALEGQGSAEVTIQVPENTGSAEVTHTISLTRTDTSAVCDTIEIVQAAPAIKTTPSMTLTYGSNTGLSSASIPRTETQLTVAVTDSDNIGWYISWDNGITLSDVSNGELYTGAKSITATVSANTSTSQKTFHIYLLSEDGDTLYTTLTITQAAKG